MIIYVDIDETICVSPKDRNYSNATPIVGNIEKINQMYDRGDNIIHFTMKVR